MYCNRLHTWWSTQSQLAILLSSIIARRWAGHQTLWWFWLKDLSIDEMVGAWCFGCCQAHWRLPVVSFALVFSFMYCWVFIFALFPFNILIVCSRRWCMDKLGVFHANQTFMCLDPHLKWGWGWRCETVICVIYVLCLSCFRICSLLPCGHLLGKGWPLGSCLWCLIVLFFLLLSHVVSWVRCGTWLINSWSLSSFLF